jgi:hypothetical protein
MECLPRMSQPRTPSFDGWLLRMDLGELGEDGRKKRIQTNFAPTDDI